MTSHSNDMVGYIKRWIQLQRLNDWRAILEEAWAHQVLDVNPDVDPYYEQKQYAPLVRQPLTPEQIEWLRWCADMDADAYARDNGLHKAW